MADENTKDVQARAEEPEQPTEGEKKFTQADVDRIVKKRLHEERARKDADQTDNQSDNAVDDERETALQLRESRLGCREYLMERGYPAGLLDILDTSDKERFGQSVDALADMFEKHFAGNTARPKQRPAPLAEIESHSLSAAAHRAIGGDDFSHTPKNKYFSEGD